MKPVPPYMQKGSRGPHVALMQVFLLGAGHGEGLNPNGDFDEVTAARFADLQRRLGIGDDGKCGPQTRKSIKGSSGFDFEAVCQVIPGTTMFVQSDDGMAVEWSPVE